MRHYHSKRAQKWPPLRIRQRTLLLAQILINKGVERFCQKYQIKWGSAPLTHLLRKCIRLKPRRDPGNESPLRFLAALRRRASRGVCTIRGEILVKIDSLYPYGTKAGSACKLKGGFLTEAQSSQRKEKFSNCCALCGLCVSVNAAPKSRLIVIIIYLAIYIIIIPYPTGSPYPNLI